MISYLNKKTGRRYLLLAHGVDCTNSREGTPVVVYCLCEKQHSIFVRELSEFNALFIPEAVSQSNGTVH